MPYDVEICFSESDDEGAYDAVFRHRNLSGSVSMVELLSETSRRKLSRKADYFYANQPYQEKSRTGLVPALRKMLADGMPDYMVPRDIMLLGRLPLTPNGKVDRRALPIPDQDRPEMQDSYVAPAGYIQEAIAVFWSEILELEKIGARDSFLTLGGHSLKAIQIATRINETFEVQLGINDIFEQKTIENLSQRLAVMGSEIGVDVEGIAQVVVETSKLSADEIEALLE